MFPLLFLRALDLGTPRGVLFPGLCPLAGDLSGRSTGTVIVLPRIELTGEAYWGLGELLEQAVAQGQEWGVGAEEAWGVGLDGLFGRSGCCPTAGFAGDFSALVASLLPVRTSASSPPRRSGKLRFPKPGARKRRLRNALVGGEGCSHSWGTRMTVLRTTSG